VELYDDWIEVANPGNSLIEVDRINDERRSRKQKFAAAMREIGICEERGAGPETILALVLKRKAPTQMPAPS
jgi:predicted HTH transcriptional regulator